MAINPHDDYEKLAKLLYPSIEASGNVYYGQTRKLALDELFNKNDNGFHSHIESIRVDDSASDYGYTYESYFYWKVGSLKGAIKVNTDAYPVGNANHGHLLIPETFPDIDILNYKIITLPGEQNYSITIPGGPTPEGLYITDKILRGTIFAKYEIILNSNAISNRLNSGEFKTYETVAQCEFKGIFTTNNRNPIDIGLAETADDRNFYVYSEDNHHYIYVKIAKSGDEYYNLPVLTPLTLRAKGGKIKFKLEDHITFSGRGLKYTYSINDGQEQECLPAIRSTSQTGTIIELNDGDYVRLKYTSGVLPVGAYGSVKFVTVSNEEDTMLEAYGNVNSMCSTDFSNNSVTAKALYRLFYEFLPLISSPSMPAMSLSENCYMQMYYNCSNLLVADDLPATTLASHCYREMFYNCTNLKNAPRIHANANASDYCFDGMFNQCADIQSAVLKVTTSTGAYNFREMFKLCKSLNELWCFITDTNSITGSKMTGMLSDTHSGTLYVPLSTNSTVKNKWINQGIVPSGWAIKEVNLTTYSPDFKYSFNVNHLCDNLTGYITESGDAQYCMAETIVSSGSNSNDNGRGDITKENTADKMETSFDENNTHQMNSYNKDGSFNQEIWGYKSFNSPVQFRNGIYDEYTSQIAYVTHTPDNEYSVAGSSIKLNSKDSNTDKTSKLVLGTIEDIGTEYNCYNGTGTCITSGDCDNTSPGISLSYTSDSSAVYSTLGTFCGKYTGYTYNSSYTGFVPEYIYDACRCEMTSIYKNVCYSIIESETRYTDAADNEYNINKITLMEKNVQGGYSSINMVSTPYQENHSIELKTTNILGSGTSSLKTSKITLSSNNTSNYSYIDVSSDKLYLTGATTVSESLNVSGTTTLSATTLSGATTVSGSLNVSGATALSATTISSTVTTRNIKPNTANTYSIGESDNRYSSIYTKYLHGMLTQLLPKDATKNNFYVDDILLAWLNVTIDLESSTTGTYNIDLNGVKYGHSTFTVTGWSGVTPTGYLVDRLGDFMKVGNSINPAGYGAPNVSKITISNMSSIQGVEFEPDVNTTRMYIATRRVDDLQLITDGKYRILNHPKVSVSYTNSSRATIDVVVILTREA